MKREYEAKAVKQLTLLVFVCREERKWQRNHHHDCGRSFLPVYQKAVNILDVYSLSLWLTDV